MALPRAALAYLSVVVLAAAGVLVAVWLGPGTIVPQGAARLGLAALLFLLAVLASQFPLPVSPGRKVTVASAIYFTTILLVDLPLAVWVIAGSRLVGEVVRSLRARPAPALPVAARSLLFNTAQQTLAFGLGGAVHRALAPRGGGAALDGIESLWAVPAAGLVAYLANTGLVAGMVALQRKKSFWGAWLPGRREDAPQFLALYATGLVAALAAAHYEWALLVMVLPAGMIYVSLKRTVELAEQAQLQLETLKQLSAQREELARQTAEAAALHELDRTKNELITTISHELRTPITVIHGYAQMLKMRQGVIEPKKMETLAQAVYVNSTQLQRLVQDLVDVGRVERGTFTLETEEFDISEALRDVVAGMQAREGGTRVVYEDGASLTIVADRTRVVQVASNLVENAIKYAPDGPIRVRVRRTGDVVRVEVEDSGPGVPAEEQARVWEKFFRGADVVRHNLQRGTGIGLALVKALVEAQGGCVGLQAAPTGGALFWFELPGLQTKAKPAQAPETGASSTGPRATFTRMSPTSLRVA
ncbi:MAG TPA: HAMP domain-containing sensor histidine kinase [Chloroflexota bacterium]|jgi:signal transduction histidine kinase|nr:HAMP domain-containing sensor histidine kinase [Chloroflexota bacterium]